MEFRGEPLRVLPPAQGVLPSFTFIQHYSESSPTSVCTPGRWVLTPTLPVKQPRGAWRQATPTFHQPGCPSPQGDVGLDRGLVVLDHPAGKLPPVQCGLCRPHVLQRVGPVWVSCDLRRPHGVDLVPVFHPGEVQVGGIEVAHVASEIHSVVHMDVRPSGLRGDRHGGDN